MRKITTTVCALSILFYLSNFAYAQSDFKAKLKAMKPKDFPTQPIEFVVVAPAGGGMDATARILAEYVEKYTESRCIVANKAGGAGLIGHTYLAAQAKNDGYTVGVLGNNFLTDDLLRVKGKWIYTDMEPLAYINDDPVNWIVLTKGPLGGESIKDVFNIAKQKPETLKVAMSPDMHFQFLLEQVEMISGAKFIAVPFQGGKPGIVAMMGGHLDIATGFPLEYQSYLQAGQVKVLAATGKERSVYSPDVPTFNEALGVENILWSMWRWAAVPKGVPRDRFKYLEVAIDAALHDPECINKYNEMGTKVGLKYMGPKQTSDELEKQYKAFKEFFVKKGRISG